MDRGLLNTALNAHIVFAGLFRFLHGVHSQNARMIKKGNDHTFQVSTLLCQNLLLEESKKNVYDVAHEWVSKS